MRNVFFLTVIVFLSGLIFNVQGEPLKIGEVFPIEKLPVTSINSDNKIVIFIPSLTEECDYASMLTQSFYYYFDQKFAFENPLKSPNIQIILVVNDKQNEANSVQNIIGKMDVVYDETAKIFNEFGIVKPTDKNVASTVVLLDSANKIALVDKNYRSQGEHLKPLENKLKQLNGIYQKPTKPANQKELKVGDKAPDFQIKSNQKLSDLNGEVVLLSFYPAAFSGILPKRLTFKSFELWQKQDLMEYYKIDKSNKSSIDIKIVEIPKSYFNLDSSLMSCATQIDKLDKIKLENKEAVRVAISSSTVPILEEWEEVLGTENIIYANDNDYSVSLKYGSFNPNGYNNRVSVIIDRKGRIAFIDKDFGINSEKVLNAKLENLLSR